MSRPSDNVQTVLKTVVFFDICSSTTILEDLLRTENQRRWRNLHIKLKQFLVSESRHTPFEIYKFLGDGWILLFDQKSISGRAMMEFLDSICHEYAWLFHNGICEVLEGNSHQVGLTFGIDTGTLVKFIMNQRVEYVGRALNVAARLQAAVKQEYKKPEGKLLISKNAFVSLRLSNIRKYQGKLVERELRNISDGKKYQARKIIVSG